MWTKSHSIITKEVSKEQMWKLMSNVDNWTSWDKSIELAKLNTPFETGGSFQFRPNGGPTMTIKIKTAIPNQQFTDLTNFPLAKMEGDHRFEDCAEGLKITTTMSVKGILSLLWIKLVASKIVASLPEDMQIQIEAAKKL
jgi:hypothetical protein